VAAGFRFLAAEEPDCVIPVAGPAGPALPLPGRVNHLRTNPAGYRPARGRLFGAPDASPPAMFAQGMRALADQRSALALDRDPVRALRQAARAFLAFCVQDPVRYQLLFERVVPDFAPSAASMELSAGALRYVEAWHHAAGLTDQHLTRPDARSDSCQTEPPGRR
jgi:hypothetical protein